MASVQTPHLSQTSGALLDTVELPGVVDEIAQTIGVMETLKLVEEWGGTRLYVPTEARLKPDHPLCRVIGLENAKKLAKEYGGLGHFDLPRCVAVIRAVRNNAIRADRAEGRSISKIALKYRMTERAIRNILGEAQDERQIQLEWE